MLQISEQASSAVSKAILITGSARSGTTIMGKIIHSMEGVEYLYEPPMMFTLFALINQIPERDWRLLYETYLYEEFFLNAIAGRAINCNKADDSSIYKVKLKEEIEKRLEKSLSKLEAEEYARHHVIAFKIPDVVPFVPILKRYYPSTRVIVMMRNAVETLNSLLKKRWFSPENETSNLIWPFRLYKGVHVPFWVREGDEELWFGLSELDRAAYYYIRVNETVEEIEGRIEVKYSHLLAKPKKVVSDIADMLGLRFGAMTEEIINQIRPTTPDRDYKILDRVRQDFREKVEYYSELSG